MEQSYHIGVVPAPGSGRGGDDVLMRSGPGQDGLDRAPRVVHVIEVAPVVTHLTNGFVVGLRGRKTLFYIKSNMMYGVITEQNP